MKERDQVVKGRRSIVAGMGAAAAGLAAAVANAQAQERRGPLVGSVTSNELIFIGPSNTITGPNQYKDWETMLAVATALDGQVKIILDTTFGRFYDMPAPAVTGTPYDLSGIEILGLRQNDPFGGPQLTIKDGVTLSELPNFRGNLAFNIVWESTSAPIFTQSGLPTICFNYGQITHSMHASALFPACQVDDGFCMWRSGGLQLFFNASASSAPFFNIDGPTGRVTFGMNSGLCQLSDDAIAGDGRVDLEFRGGASRNIQKDLSSQSGFTGTIVIDNAPHYTATPQWLTGVVVATNTVTLSDPGYAAAVHATLGTTPGPKQQIEQGTPASGEVLVGYDADGVATLTFAAGDGITEASVHYISLGGV